MSKLFIIHFVSFLIILSANMNLTAEPVFDLGEITVTAEKSEIVKANPVIKITAEKITDLNAQNIGESLKFSPSVIYRQARSKREYYLNVRGLEQEHITVLLDGMPLNQPYDGVLDLQNIMTADVSEISLIKGSASPIYGGQGIAGILNVITKKSTDKNGYLTLQYGTSNFQNYDVNFSKTINKFTFFAAGSYGSSDDIPISDPYVINYLFGNAAATYSNSKKLENTDYIKRSISFKTTYNLTEKSILGFTTEYYNNIWGVAPHFVSNVSNGKERFRIWRFTDWERATYNLIYKYEHENFALKTRLFLDNFDNSLDQRDIVSLANYNGETYTQAISKYDDQLYGGNLVLSKNFNNISTELSLNFKQDKHSEQSNSVSPWLDFKSRTYSIGNLNTFKIRDNLKLQAGLSWDMLDKVLVQEIKNGNVSDTVSGKSVKTVNPYFTAIFDVAKNSSIAFSYAKKIKFPTLKNLYSRSVDGTNNPGNPDLKEERSDNFNLNFEHSINNGLLSLGCFYYDIDNHIIFNNISGTYKQFDARIYGIEFSGLKKINNWSTDCSITLLKARNDSNNLPSKKIEYKPEIQANAGITYSKNGYRFILNNKYIGRQTYYEYRQRYYTAGTNPQTGKLDDYILTDIKLEKKFMESHSLFVNIKNIFDKSYFDMLYMPGAGRIIHTGYSFSF
ncbi:TonB-dependent receptor [Candidatus Dependentiae bacterium]|nr:TonB-dependent receptor [Candidatus Dependentiae bacterium]